MAFSLFAPPQTDWLSARREREGSAVGGFDRAIGATRRDALTAARGVAGPGGGAAAARAATQAVAPELARLRAGQANALADERRRISADQQAELVARGDFMNNLLGGVAGLVGQAGVPLLSGLGGGPAAPSQTEAFVPPAPGTAAAPAAAPNYGLLPASAGPPMGSAPAAPSSPAMPAAPATAPLVGPDGMTEEERRRRTMGGGGLGGLANAAAPFAGMVNPLFGLGLGAAGRLF